MPPPSLTPDLLLAAYAQGIFPMGETRDTPGVYWVEPQRRGVIPLDGLHISRTLRRALLADTFRVTVDTAFDQVMLECASPAPGREESWINDTIRRVYGELHERGNAHSVEAWQDGALVGGLYGVRLGGAFFGESMFSRATDASKVALVHLVARLRAGGFRLLDTQFVTAHLARLGAVEIPRGEYRRLLRAALPVDADFYRLPPELPGALSLQSVTHTS